MSQRISILAILVSFISNFPLTTYSSLDVKCQASSLISISYWNQVPYITTNIQGSSQAEGIFPTLLREAFRTCCPAARKLEFKKVNSGPAGLVELLDGADFDMIAPVGGAPNGEIFGGFPFIGIADSSGSAVLMAGNASGARLLFSVLRSWPILVFIVISASLAGVVIWFLERKENPEQFPAPFSIGVFEGFWWAFVTMTTVGYGDKAPKSLFGKLLGSVWILAGLIITTMFISIITSALAEASAAEGQANVRGVMVSVVNQSAEHKLAIRQNAKITALVDQQQALQQLTNDKVDAALVDVHSLKHQISELKRKFILVASVIPNHVSYGMVLAKNSPKLEACFREFMDVKENWRYQLLLEKAGTRKVQITPAEDYFASGGIFSISVYVGLGLFAGSFCVGMGWEYYKHRRKTTDKNKGSGKAQGDAKSTKSSKIEENTNDLQTTHIPLSPANSRQTNRSQQYRAEIVVNAPRVPPPRLSFGSTPQEQLLSRQSMEVMEMENQFNQFKTEWEKRYSMLQGQQNNGKLGGVTNGGFINGDGKI